MGFPSGFLRRQAGHRAGVAQVPLLSPGTRRGPPGGSGRGMSVRSRGGSAPGQRRLRPRCHLQGTVPRDSATGQCHRAVSLPHRSGVTASPERCHRLTGAVSVSPPPGAAAPPVPQVARGGPRCAGRAGAGAPPGDSRALHPSAPSGPGSLSSSPCSAATSASPSSPPGSRSHQQLSGYGQPDPAQTGFKL